MSRWKQWASPPAGALPGGIVTKAGVVLIAVLVAGLLVSWAAAGPGESAEAPRAGAEAQAVGDGVGRSLAGRIRAETQRQTQLAAARARADLERRVAAAEEAAEVVARAEAPGAAAAALVETGAAEAELQASLRLEELERRTRSLRSLPVAQSYRDPDAAREPSGAEGRDAGSAAEAALTEAALLENTLHSALASFEQSFGTLDDELAAEARLLASLGAAGPAGELARPEAVGRPPGAGVPPARPPPSDRPERSARRPARDGADPRGLVSRGGPRHPAVGRLPRTRARHRLRPLLFGRPAADPDPARNARRRHGRGRSGPGPEPAGHRLPPPAPSRRSWIDLEFHGLNQVAESALRDEVERHYLSTFAAAGAVGVVGGLTLAGSAPYGVRAGIGQGLGQSTAGILDRFLNRRPTITIRAGHRLRIWFTSDVLVPRPGTRP